MNCLAMETGKAVSLLVDVCNTQFEKETLVATATAEATAAAVLLEPVAETTAA